MGPVRHGRQTDQAGTPDQNGLTGKCRCLRRCPPQRLGCVPSRADRRRLRLVSGWSPSRRVTVAGAAPDLLFRARRMRLARSPDFPFNGLPHPGCSRTTSSEQCDCTQMDVWTSNFHWVGHRSNRHNDEAAAIIWTSKRLYSQGSVRSGGLNPPPCQGGARGVELGMRSRPDSGPVAGLVSERCALNRTP